MLMHVQRRRNVTLTAADLASAVQADRNFSFVHLGVGLFYVIGTLVAVVLGVLGRDRGQFVFAALFAWLAVGEWQRLSASLPPGLASGVWPPALWAWRLELPPDAGRGAAAASCASAHRAGTAGWSSRACCSCCSSR